MDKNLFQTFFDNFFKFDFIIFILAALNLFFLLKSLQYSRKLSSQFDQKLWIAGGKKALDGVTSKFHENYSPAGRESIMNLHKKSNSWTSLFENTTTLFPLLGLLGTVVALIPMVDSIGDSATGLFFGALTSTFWGIVFAIIYKAADGFIAANIDGNERNVQIYLQEYNDFKNGELPDSETPVSDHPHQYKSKKIQQAAEKATAIRIAAQRDAERKAAATTAPLPTAPDVTDSVVRRVSMEDDE